jgi:hypothetical protein
MMPWRREPTLPPVRSPRRTPTAPGPEHVPPRPVTRTPTHPGPDAPLVRRTPTLPAESPELDDERE